LASGAILPAGYSLPIRVNASDDLGVERIELTRDDESTPFATFVPPGGVATPFQGTTSVVLPSPASGYAWTTLTATVYDGSGNSAWTAVNVRSTPAVDLKADGAGSNSWSALEDQVAVLRSGVLTLSQPITLAGLIVLPGATLTHAPALASPD